jgi:hypothetical protein
VPLGREEIRGNHTPAPAFFYTHIPSGGVSPSYARILFYPGKDLKVKELLLGPNAKNRALPLAPNKPRCLYL